MARRKPQRSTKTRRQRQSERVSRNKAKTQLYERIRFYGLIALSGIAVVGLGYGGYLYTQPEKYEALHRSVERKLAQWSNEAGFSVAQIYIEGRENTPLTTIKQAINVKPGDPLLLLSLESLRAKLTALPEVRDATVYRQLPDRLTIVIHERQPSALWQHGGAIHVLDADGVLLENQVAEQMTGLPVLVGEDAPEHAASLLAMINASVLSGEVVAASRVGGRRWDVLLHSGLRLKLPEKDPEMALARLAELQREQGLLDRQVDVIDMRLEDRLFVETREQMHRQASYRLP